MSRARIGELLVEARFLTQAQLDDALRVERPPGKKLGAYLVEKGHVNETQLTQTLSLQLAVPWVSLYHVDFSRQLLNLVPRDLADKYNVVPIFVRHVKGQGQSLYVAMDDPANETAIAEITKAAALPVKPMIACPTDIRAVIRVYYTPEGEAPPPPPAPVAPSAPAPPVPQMAAPPGAPPPPPHAARRPPPAPPTGRAPLATVVDAMELMHTDLLATSEEPVMRVETPSTTTETRAASPSESGDSPSADPELEVSEFVPKRRPSQVPRMVALTLLDGTQLELPARSSPPAGEMEETAAPKRQGSIPPSAGGMSSQLTARDLVSALRAVSHGADASEVIGETSWQAMFAALLSLMLKKNLIADWEFIEELRNI